MALIYGIVLFLTFLFGIVIGLMIHFFIRKYVDKLITEQKVEKDTAPISIENLTKQDLDEWLNGGK